LYSPKPDTYSPPVDSRTILAGVEHQKGYSEAGWLLQLPDVLLERIVRDLRCFPVWRRTVHQADVEPHGETVLPARSAQRLA
jgi:hypothetical protein